MIYLFFIIAVTIDLIVHYIHHRNIKNLIYEKNILRRDTHRLQSDWRTQHSKLKILETEIDYINDWQEMVSDWQSEVNKTVIQHNKRLKQIEPPTDFNLMGDSNASTTEKS